MSSASPPLTPESNHGEAAGDRIGRYKLLEAIGEGGMGTVWMAEQQEPVRRRVALKVIKLGMDTREVVARFEAERQALALMDHPSIARVLDGGATSVGRPFFVMELVRGTPITDYCDRANASVRERVALFAQVCEAIQHAHSKGIIHRDIKPSNVMVTLYDGVPVPKVIDFGIAKATGAELTQRTLFTSHAQLLGTPEYMAPEQAELSGMDIDTRADVYSLGVLLYELLTGAKPFDIREVLANGYDEMLRTIREVDPAKPSTRVSTNSNTATAVSARGTADTQSLSKRLRGELDWVVMKALEKDRTRRYETALGFAEDARRYLAGEPVMAAPPSNRYRMVKFVRRRRKTVAAGAAVLLALLLGSIGTALGWQRALDANRDLDQALQTTELALQREAEQRLRAQEAEDLARQEAERAGAAEESANHKASQLAEVVHFQTEQLKRIDTAAMGSSLRGELIERTAGSTSADTLRSVLEQVNFTDVTNASLRDHLFTPTRNALESGFAEQPLTRAELFQSLGRIQESLGMMHDAVELQRIASDLYQEQLGPESRLTLKSQHALAGTLALVGAPKEALEIYVDVEQSCRRLFGDDDPLTIKAIDNVAYALGQLGRDEEALRYHREAVERGERVLSSTNEDLVMSKANYGTLLGVLGRPGGLEQIEMVSEALRESEWENTNDWILAQGNLASTYQNYGETETAAAILQDVRKTAVDRLGHDHPVTTQLTSRLFEVSVDIGEIDRAFSLLREEFESIRRRPERTLQWSIVAEMLAQLRPLASATEVEALFKDAIAIRSPFHATALERFVLSQLNNELGVHYANAQEHDRALSSYIQAWQLRDTTNASMTTTLLGNIETGFAEALAQKEARGDAVGVGDLLRSLGRFRIDSSDFSGAESALRRSLTQQIQGQARDDPRKLYLTQSELGFALSRLGRFDEAAPLLLESAGWAMDTHPELEQPDIRELAERLSPFYEAWYDADPLPERSAAALEWRRIATK